MSFLNRIENGSQLTISEVAWVQSLSSATLTKGNIYVANGTGWTVIGVGSNGQVLSADSTQTTGLKWVAQNAGDVVGPSGATADDIATFDGTTGKLIKDGGNKISSLVPYTGASGDLNLGANNLLVAKITTSGDIELGNASDTTLSRVSSGVVSIEGVNIVKENRTINGKALSSDITLGLASSDFANQGTTTTVLHGNASGATSFSPIVEADISLANNTTNNATTSKHGFLDQLPGGTTLFKRADGAWAAPAATTVPNAYLSEAFSYTANTSHNIVHNFGTYPLVQAFDASGYQLIPLSVQNTDVNTVAITFDSSATYTVVLTLGSPALTNYTATSSNYTVLANDYLVNETGSGKTITLPTAVGRSGKIFIIKNSSAGICDVIFTSGQNADGYTDITIASKDAYTFVSNGTNYLII